MNFQQMYQRRVVTVEEALEQVKSHHEVVCALAASEPATILSKLHTIKDRVEDVSVVSALMMGEYEFYLNPEMKGHFLLNSWFYTGGPRKGHQHGTVTYMPMQLHNFSSRRMAYRSPNIFMGSACPMDKHGYFSLSLSTVMEKDFIEHADVVILEVNPNLPRTYGDTLVHIADIDYIVETDREIAVLPAHQLEEKDYLIGAYVADLIEDGSTIQIGMGSIPSAVAQSLCHKKDLGVHSEVFNDSILDLYEAGAITNRKKTLWRDKFVTTVALGTSKHLYDFLDNNLAVEFHRASIVNDPAVIGRNHKMVSINSALQVDLTGQCGAESVGPRLFSGTGGHKEFVTGSQESAGGKSIVAFHSTTKDEKASHIVPWLEAGTVVTTSRVDLDYVVTEYGVAALRGRSVRERIQELINIAHPNFRDYLRSEVNRNRMW